ncbi:molybdopterin-dependent oxidoreductase [Spongiibacter taiwanensis]|uniref:xanthine dehydrogenase family protein molybdopterin-binding subunit n=1 Tax=Spongiibacter taiwanensis TaxID=1748242 RepID=UPI002035A760|nr:molybdopterin cofactor-binding domain-containing protein [Spongiibacter taiwanensis]USA43499.1 molybdopterin-dependent oxidoreductase [Spongiibacter taiwanensis]
MKMKRRQFLKSTALVGGGFAVGFHLSSCEQPPNPGSADELSPNAFLQLNSAGEIVLQLHKSEMGQGVYTGMATLAAEELGINPAELKIVQAQFHPAYRDPEMRAMVTGGSTSLKGAYQPLREAAAVMGELLRHATSYQLGVPKERVFLRNGHGIYEDQMVSFAELLPVARKLPLPEQPPLKASRDFRYIGQFDQRLDNRDKVTGKAQFGLDAQYPNALTAVLLRCPHFGGSLTSFDAAKAREKSGVHAIFEMDGAIAVVATSYWQARQAANLVEAEWDKGPLAGLSNAEISDRRRQQLDSDERRTAEEVGEENQFTGAVFSAEYQVPLLAHGTMEPMNALAVVNDQTLEIWSGNQALEIARSAVADAVGFPREQVVIHNSMLGGGFGRRLNADYLVEAAKLAVHLASPVRVVWSREDDIRHDFYRPGAAARLTAKIDDGRLTGVHAEVVCPSLLKHFVPTVTNSLLPAWTPDRLHSLVGGLISGFDPTVTEGLVKYGYQFGYTKTDFIEEVSPVPVGFWRSVGHSHNAFFIESFVDELAHEFKQDPVAFRQRLLPTQGRHQTVLKLAAEKAGWGNPKAGQFQGVALHESFNSIVAQVVDLSVEHGQIRVHKVVCVVDCGLAVNPDIVRMQMESGIIFGLTAALKGQITLRDGAVQQSNFHDYELLRLFESPEIDVVIVDSHDAPTGVGEPGVPPIAPAVANAVFAATGQRLRALPLRLAPSA